MSDSPLMGCVRPERFVSRNRDLVSMNQLRWQLRNRNNNGMVDAGAVLEVRSRPDQKRPLLVIDEARYIDWLRDQGKYLRRAANRQQAAA